LCYFEAQQSFAAQQTCILCFLYSLCWME